MITEAVADERSLLTFTALDGGAELTELLGAIQRLSLVRSLAEIEEIVPAAARRLTGSDGAALVLRDGDDCLYADEDAVGPLWKGRRQPLDECADGWTIRDRKPVAIADVQADARAAPDFYGPTFVRGLATVPIRQLDPLGAIGSYWAQPHDASARELQLLQVLADSAAVALGNVRAYTELADAQAATLNRLALAGEYRDDATFRHTARVAHVAAQVATRLGLGEAFVSLIRRAAPLHDIGKLAVSDAILLKQDFLTATEILHMRVHPECGAEILTGSSSDVLKLAEEIALTHHEWWDGSGYPHRLAGDAIPISGRIVALADVFDALTHARPYKQPWTLDEALREIDHLSGTQFDPMVVAAFFDLDEADLTPNPDELIALVPGIHAPTESKPLVVGPSA